MNFHRSFISIQFVTEFNSKKFDYKTKIIVKISRFISTWNLRSALHSK